MDPDGEVCPLPQLVQLVREFVSYFPAGQLVQLVREVVSSLPAWQSLQLEEVWLEDDWYWPLLHDTHEPPDNLSPLEHDEDDDEDERRREDEDDELDEEDVE